LVVEAERSFCVQGESLQAQVLRQMREKQLAAKRKREMMARSTYR
jgi:hypothetical protein